MSDIPKQNSPGNKYSGPKELLERAEEIAVFSRADACTCVRLKEEIAKFAQAEIDRVRKEEHPLKEWVPKKSLDVQDKEVSRLFNLLQEERAMKEASETKKKWLNERLEKEQVLVDRLVEKLEYYRDYYPLLNVHWAKEALQAVKEVRK